MTKREQNNYWKRWDNFQQQMERKYTPRFTKALRIQLDAFIKSRDVATIPAFPIYDVLVNLYKYVGPKWATSTREIALKQDDNFVTGQMGFNARIVELMQQYYGVDLLNDANLMTQYSREIIIRVLSQAAQTGASFDEIVAALIKHPEFGPMRARRIARTETVTSANGAAMIYAQESGNQLNKYWIAVKDSRTRHDHRQVDGKVVDYDQPFTINSIKYGIVKMMQPGVRIQPNGLEVPAGEVVNCRCVVAFKAKRDANGNIIRSNVKPVNNLPVFQIPPKPIPIEAIPQPNVISISNARSIKEAEIWAKENGITKNVSYSGMNVNDVNKINNIMKRVITDFNLQPLQNLKGGSKSLGLGNGIEIKFNKSKTTPDEIRRIFNDNVVNYKKIYEQRLKQFEDITDPSKTALKNKAIKQTQYALNYDRYLVHRTENEVLEDLFIHELGHTIEDQLLGLINRRLILPKYGTINPATRLMEFTNEAKLMRDEYMNIYKNLTDAERFSISKYSNQDLHETFAESLVMFYREPEKMPKSLFNFFIKLKDYANK